MGNRDTNSIKIAVKNVPIYAEEICDMHTLLKLCTKLTSTLAIYGIIIIDNTQNNIGR